MPLICNYVLKHVNKMLKHSNNVLGSLKMAGLVFKNGPKMITMC